MKRASCWWAAPVAVVGCTAARVPRNAPFPAAPPEAAADVPFGAATDASFVALPFVAASNAAAAPEPLPAGATDFLDRSAWGSVSPRFTVDADDEAAAEAAKSYVIPAVEILSFEFLLNQFDRRYVDSSVYGSDWSTFKSNLHRGWIVDHDPFETNQLFHPYAGSLYFGFARSTGHGYWESLVYTFVGSALWETAGEVGRPSLNDQFSTSFGGSFIGEVFFRMANWWLEGDPDGFATGLRAGLVSPPNALNRLLFGSRFDGISPSNDPAVYSRIKLGAIHNREVSDQGSSKSVPDNEAYVDYEMEYGLPGKASYDYDQPFDYFDIKASATSGTDGIFKDAMIRGLLVGGKYGHGDVRGIGGLYGTYDYLSPQVFHLSTTALNVGTTAQWWASRSVAVSGTFLGGVGYGAVGTIADTEPERDYHYGIDPQGLVALRAVFFDFAMLELTGRDYYFGGGGDSGNQGGRENVFRWQAGLTVDLHEGHAIGLFYERSHRDALYTGFPNKHQNIESVGLVYTCLLGNTHLGAVAWERPH